MSHTHQMQANRFELKYIISGTKAIGVRDFVRPYLTPDEYADPKKNNSYWIHSLYLDDPELTLCNSTVRGLKNRFKLRIRFYDDIPHHPVFFEIKARVNDVILKERVAVHRKSVGRLVRHPMPERSDLLKCDGKNWDVLQRFCRFRRVIEAGGKSFVSYLREAYVSPHDDSVRVTFDRCIHASPYNDDCRVEPIDAWLQPPIEGVVLELKFTDRFPGWMGDLTRSFDLTRACMAKYVFCAQSMGKYKLLSR